MANGAQPPRQIQPVGLLRVELAEDRGEILRVGQQPGDVDGIVVGADEVEPAAGEAGDPQPTQPGQPVRPPGDD